MSLIGEPVTAAVAASPKARKMIHVNGTSDSSVIKYEVPEGRKFVGRVVGSNNSSYFRLPKNTGETVLIGKQGSTTEGAYFPIELLAGQTVNLSYSHLIGVESDE